MYNNQRWFELIGDLNCKTVWQKLSETKPQPHREKNELFIIWDGSVAL